ncbi:hypothetical protein [Amycolatopsis sp. NPDC004378]
MENAEDLTPEGRLGGRDEQRPTRRVPLRAVLWVAGVVVFCVAVVARIGRFGFAPTDQGFVPALSWRVLHGEIPHVDTLSVRPLGSAYLHTGCGS